MQKQERWAPGPGIRVIKAEFLADRWVVTAEVYRSSDCPDCGAGATRRHGAYVRCLQDLPVQGERVELQLRMIRWRCDNQNCHRQTFAGQIAGVAKSYARQTGRVTELARLLAYTAGGRGAERLLRRLGLPQGDDRILRNLKRAAAHFPCAPIRVAGIDDWSWRRGTRYGTIVVDLERRAVVDVLHNRSAATMTQWLQDHPTIEVVSRDRCGLYAQAARQGAPQARQIADRFHLVENLRFAIERQLSLSYCPSRRVNSAPRRDTGPSVWESGRRHGPLEHDGRRQVWLERFAAVKQLQSAGESVAAIAVATGLDWRTVTKWARSDVLPERRKMDPRSNNPTRFIDFLARRWAEGRRTGRQLLSDIREQGYTGSRSHLERLLLVWRREGGPAPKSKEAAASDAARAPIIVVPPITASILCMTPRSLLTERQAGRVDWLKEHLPGFASLRHFAMRFRGILRGRDPSKLDIWMADAHAAGFPALQRFAQMMRRDIEAVRNAVRERWSNGQTEGQINKLKTLKRAMYGRAGIELIRARMLPLIC
jgi:transposase